MCYFFSLGLNSNAYRFAPPMCGDSCSTVYVCLGAQSCLTLCDPLDYSLLGSSVAHQAPLSMGLSRQEYWSGLSFPPPGESFWLRNLTWVSCISRWILYHWATREAPCSGTHSVVLNPLPPLLTIYFIFSMTVYSLNSSPSYFWDAVLEYCLFSEGWIRLTWRIGEMQVPEPNHMRSDSVQRWGCFY